MKMSDDRQVCKGESEEEAGPGVRILRITPPTRGEGMRQEGLTKAGQV